MTTRIEKTDQAWSEELTPAQYDVLRRGGQRFCINSAALKLDRADES